MENTGKYSLKVAYPTIGLTIVALVLYIGISVMALKGHMAPGWALFLNAIMAYLLFTPMHEAGHMNISGNRRSLRWIDEAIGWLSGIPLFAPFYVFKVIHFRHHAFTNDPDKDPDHWLASKNPISLLIHSTTIFPVYLVKALQLLFGKEKVPAKVRKELMIGLFAFFGLIGLIGLAVFSFGWIGVLTVWIIPAFIAQAALAFAFDWLPHHPHEEKSRYLNTRVLDIPGLSYILLGQNYHLVHHLHPRVPFYDYRTVYLGMEEKLKQKGVDIISWKGTDVKSVAAH